MFVSSHKYCVIKHNKHKAAGNRLFCFSTYYVQYLHDLLVTSRSGFFVFDRMVDFNKIELVACTLEKGVG